MHMAKEYIIIESNEYGPYNALPPSCKTDAEKQFCKSFITQICEHMDYICQEYCQLNKETLILQPGEKTFYDILCISELVDAFIEFCSNTKGITINDTTAEIKTDNINYRVDILKIDPHENKKDA